MTNGDRIRAMTDGELGELINRMYSCSFCIYSEKAGPCLQKDCATGVSQWVKQEADDD